MHVSHADGTTISCIDHMEVQLPAHMPIMVLRRIPVFIFVDNGGETIDGKVQVMLSPMLYEGSCRSQ